jgi:flagellar hook-associated protein 2
MSSSTSSIFSGSSRYSNDLKSALDRAVAIASLPISQLNKDKTALDDQSKALATIGEKFTSLQTAIDGLGEALSSSSYTATVSDTSALSVSLSTGALEGVYKVEVKDAGAYAASMSSTSWAGGSSPVTYELKVGSETYEITADNNQAATIAAAINAKAGSVVRATVVNVGGAASPDYRLSLQSTQLGDLTPHLMSGSTDLVSEQTQGRLATYQVNDSGIDVTSTTRSVSIANGVSVSLLAAKPAVEITVTRSSAAVSDALSAFATAYNNALGAVDEQRGQSDGALSGQPVVSDLSQTLRSLATYADSGSSLGGLEALGLELQKDGTLSFNQFTFVATDLTNSAGVVSFFGSSTTGGFLKAAYDAMSFVQDSSAGLLAVAESSIASQSAQIDDSIAIQQDRVDALTERLQNQMAAADALISSMEQQYTQITTLFESMRLASQQYQ